MKAIRHMGSVVVVCLLLSLAAIAQKAPDKAYLDKIWSVWESGNVEGETQYYAQGPHVFFDDEPLKYNSWDEFKKHVTPELAEYKSMKFHVNDDAQIHRASATTYWGSSTVDFDMVKKDGKEEKGTFRWTFIFENQNGKWVLVHEHVSLPSA